MIPPIRWPTCQPSCKLYTWLISLCNPGQRLSERRSFFNRSAKYLPFRGQVSADFDQPWFRPDARALRMKPMAGRAVGDESRWGAGAHRVQRMLHGDGLALQEDERIGVFSLQLAIARRSMAQEMGLQTWGRGDSAIPAEHGRVPTTLGRAVGQVFGPFWAVWFLVRRALGQV